jgi:hypothetical protein
MESRELLTGVLPPTTTGPALPIAPPAPDQPLTAQIAPAPQPAVLEASSGVVTPAPYPTNPRVLARDRIIAHRQAARDARLASRHVTNNPLAENSSSPASSVGNAGALAVKTAWNGYWLTHSKDVAHVGLSYAKLTVSDKSRKVGFAYLKAAVKGDGKTLDQLGHTQAVKQVGTSFSQLGRSSGVKSLGHKFSSLGRSFTDRFHNIFG